MTSKKSEQILAELLKEEANRHCADCGQKPTRWASWNIGVFLCIRCGGLHRKLGTHISKVKSVTLDTWEDEQSMGEKGNARMNAMYNPDPARFPFPSFSGDMEQYIRDKYERKIFMNPSNRASVGPLSLNNQSRKSFIDAKPIDYSKELRQLHEMGFTDKNKCLSALETHNGNVFNCLDQLSSKSPIPSQPMIRQDPYAELIENDFSKLSIEESKHENIFDEGNGWTDLEFSKPIELPPREERLRSFEPEPISESTSIVPLTSSSLPTASASGQSSNDPWTSPALGSSNLSTVLGSTSLFEEDDDPFKDLTHNPFK